MSKVLVVGDVIVDRYFYGAALGLSAETPTIVAKHEKEEAFVGGAGLVARHLVRLGSNVHLVYVNGNGPGHVNVRQILDDSPDPLNRFEKMRFDDEVVVFPGWSVVQKKRYFVDGHKLLQFDVLNDGKHDETTESDLIDHTLSKTVLKRFDAVVVCDNRHGFFNEKIARHLVETCDELCVPLCVDSQVSQSKPNHVWYAGCRVMFVNKKELLAIAETCDVHDSYDKNYVLESLGRKIAKVLNCGIVLKMGKDGAWVFGDIPVPLPGPFSDGHKVDVVDTCGAGDALLAAYVHSKGDIHFANKWAALSTTYMGTRVPALRDLERIKR